jgi:hypothetical protein
MFFPFVFVELDRKADDRAEAGGRLIPATMTAPPTRTLRRDISLIWLVLGSGTSVFLIDRIGAVTSLFNLPEIYDLVVDGSQLQLRGICYAFKLGPA